MKEINIREINNGYIYTVKGYVRNNGEYVSKNTEEFSMLERIAEILLGFKVTVTRR